MKTLEWRTRDKTTWGPGSCCQEPDKRQWQDEATGLPCLIVRGPVGALCGYVGVQAGSPLFGLGYDDCPIKQHPHGGLTFADSCQLGEAEDEGICHIPGEGEPDHVWWFGFDCAHGGDFYPGCPIKIPGLASGVYRDFAYVEAEVRELAKQLARAL